MSLAARQLIDNAADIARRISDFGEPPPSYREICDAYARLGLEPGTAVLLSAPNSAEFLLHWIAILANGLVPCAAPPAFKSAQVRALQQSLQIAVVVGPHVDPQRLGSAVGGFAGTYRIAVSDGISPAYDPFDVLILTTGTSGAQTACVHTVDTLAWNATSTNRTLGLGSDDRQLVVLPLFHTYGLVTQSLGTMLGGGELVIDGPPFNAKRFGDLIERERISVCGITPTLARDLLQREIVLPPLRSLSIGGDRFAPEDVERLLDKPFISELYVTYGLTEAGPRICVLPAHEAPRHAFDSVGRPFAGVEVRIDRPDTAGVGQLLVKTPSACRRKVGDNVLRQPFDADGFLETGDLFTQDEDGFMRYVSRRTDILVVKGEKLNIRSIDRVVESHPKVEFARTGLGADHELITRVWGRDGRELDLDEIRNYLKARLRLHEVPDRITQESREVFHK